VAAPTVEQMEQVDWQLPWRFVGIGEGAGYENALMKETAPEHPLYDKRAIAVGARVDRDDVLYLLPDEPQPLAVVSLTWASGPPDEDDERARVPETVFYSSLEDWLERGMREDRAEYLAGDRDEG
jgi:hypothetical protein